MFFLDVVLDTLAQNLALDEALLLGAEKGGPEVVRLWEWPAPAVVLGAGCKIAEDVDEQACRADEVVLLRRSSGGGTVLLGPGCLLFSLILSFDRDAHLEQVRSSHAWILDRLISALALQGVHLRREGISDLTLDGRKVSGNSQQRKRGHLLHHGTLLYHFDAAAVGRYLRLPSRQPEYRDQRGHADFLGNLPMSALEIRRTVCQAFDAERPLGAWPKELVEELVREKYGQEDRILRR